jgi:hypothetical protein
MTRRLWRMKKMKRLALCWLAGAIVVTGLSVGCSEGHKTGPASGIQGKMPVSPDPAMQREAEKHMSHLKEKQNP